MKKEALTAKQVQYAKPIPGRRQEVPAGPPAGLYLVVHPTGNKTWAYRYRFNGKTRKLTFEKAFPDMTLAAARAESEAARDNLKNGVDPAAAIEETDPEPESVESVIQDFLIRKVAGTKTETEVTRILTQEIQPAWKHRANITEVGRADVLRLLDKITDRGAPVMANRTLSVSKRLFSWCLQRGLVETSPVAPLRAPNDERSRDRVLSPGELTEIWHAAQQLGYPFGTDQRQIEFPQRRLEIPTQGLKKKSCSRPLRRPFPRSYFL